MVLLLDNYDSFTYNLYQYIGEFTSDIKVIRNDQITLEGIEELKPSHIVISPGPGHPLDAGVSMSLVKRFSGQIPILGVCLGHQAIAVAMGGKVGHAKSIVHGKLSTVHCNEKGIFKGIPETIQAVRYHSLAVLEDSFPDCLQIDAFTDDLTIMALSHKEHQTFGLQFHPESVLSEYGKDLLGNFLRIGEDDAV